MNIQFFSFTQHLTKTDLSTFPTAQSWEISSENNILLKENTAKKRNYNLLGLWSLIRSNLRFPHHLGKLFWVVDVPNYIVGEPRKISKIYVSFLIFCSCFVCLLPWPISQRIHQTNTGKVSNHFNFYLQPVNCIPEFSEIIFFPNKLPYW